MQKPSPRKAEIPIDSKLRDELRTSKGMMTWDDYLKYLKKTADDMVRKSKF